jgi:hypothetical protein
MEQFRILRVVTWVICVYHVFIGVVLNGPVPWIQWVSTTVLGATRLPDPSALFLARMLGTFALVFGLSMGLAAYDPIKNRALLSLGAILVGLRGVQRLFQAGDLESALGISAGKNWTTVLLILFFAAALGLFRYKVYREMHDAG